MLLTRKSREKGTQGPRETQDPRNPVSYFPIHSMPRVGSYRSTLWNQGPETGIFALSHTSDSEESFSLWGRRVASTRCRSYWSLEDRALLTGASRGRGRDLAQGWESKPCLARSGPTPPK